MHKLNHKGFAAVETLLVIIIVLLVGFIGYYVWHTQKTTDKSFNEASKASKSASTSTTAKSVSYLKLSDWRIEGKNEFKDPLTTAEGLDTPVPYYGFSSQKLKQQPNGSRTCSEDDASAGSIERYKATDHITFSDRLASDSDPPVANYVKTISSSEYKQIGDYYYFYRHPQAVCGDDTSLFNATVNDVKTFLQTLRSY